MKPLRIGILGKPERRQTALGEFPDKARAAILMRPTEKEFVFESQIGFFFIVNGHRKIPYKLPSRVKVIVLFYNP